MPLFVGIHGLLVKLAQEKDVLPLKEPGGIYPTSKTCDVRSY